VTAALKLKIVLFLVCGELDFDKFKYYLESFVEKKGAKKRDDEDEE